MTENRCIEVLKKMKHMFTETCAKIDENTALDMAVEAIKEIQQYRAIGTVEECGVAVERMKPKKAKGLRICNQACCPNCNTVVLDDEFWMLDEYTYYCDSCGQAVKGIDWSE